MQLSTITNSAAAPIVWTNKAGKQQEAHGDTAQAFAPRAARISAAQVKELDKLAHGQYRPFLHDVVKALTKSDVVALEKFGFQLAPTDKPGMIKLLGAIAGLWSTAKGKRKALGEVARAFLVANAAWTDVAEPLPTIDGLSDTAPSEAPAEAPAPLPTIDAALL